MSQSTDPPTDVDPFYRAPSKGMFFTISFCVFGGGTLMGIRHVLKKEKFKLDIRGSHRTPFQMAAQALLLGTGLCFGAFSAGTGAFMYTSGLTSFKEVQDTAVEKLKLYEWLHTTDPVVLSDKRRFEQMSVEEELSYWDKYFTAPRDAQEAKQEEEDELAIEDKQHQQALEKENKKKEKKDLPFWYKRWVQPLFEREAVMAREKEEKEKEEKEERDQVQKEREEREKQEKKGWIW